MMIDFTFILYLFLFALFFIVIILILLIFYLSRIIIKYYKKDEVTDKDTQISYTPIYVSLIFLLLVPLIYLVVVTISVLTDFSDYMVLYTPIFIFLLILNIYAIIWLFKKSFVMEKLSNEPVSEDSNSSAERVEFKIGRK